MVLESSMASQPRRGSCAGGPASPSSPSGALASGRAARPALAVGRGLQRCGGARGAGGGERGVSGGEERLHLCFCQGDGQTHLGRGAEGKGDAPRERGTSPRVSPGGQRSLWAEESLLAWKATAEGLRS